MIYLQGNIPLIMVILICLPLTIMMTISLVYIWSFMFRDRNQEENTKFLLSWTMFIFCWTIMLLI